MSVPPLERYKQITRTAYERHAEKFEEWHRKYFNTHVRREADLFLRSLKGKTIVDLGSGPGAHAHYFQHKGLDVTCVDYSKEMLSRCASKGVKALLVDVGNFWMPDKTVDGIWAYSVLSHIKEDEIPSIVGNFSRMLKDDGLVGVSVREGKKDRYEYVDSKSKDKRWFNYFTDEEMRGHFSRYFELHRFSRTPYDKKVVYLNYLFKKKS